MEIKYYRGFESTSGEPLSEELARAAARYTRVSFDDDGRVDSEELYQDAKLVRVEYHRYGAERPDLVAVARAHVARFPGTPYAVWRDLEAVRDHTWREVYSYDASGAAIGGGLVLTDPDRRDLMSLDTDVNQRLMQITKYHWRDDGELIYVFEYDEHGVWFSGFDVLYGDSVTLADALESLPDRAFFEHGRALPRALAGTDLPPTRT